MPYEPTITHAEKPRENRMRVFEGIEPEPMTVKEFLMSRAGSEGLLRKTRTEELTRYAILRRPFREVRFNVRRLRDDSARTVTSFLDEGLASEITDRDHAMLLWRPRYTNVPNTEITAGNSEHDDAESQEIRALVEDILNQRYEAQEYDDELGPELRRAQADPIGTIAFIVPRSPGGVRREQKMLEERSPLHAYVLASSLVTNTDPRDIIESAEFGEIVYTDTVAAEYRHLEGGPVRHLFMENPGASSMSDAMTLGKPLTRVSELYPHLALEILDKGQ